MIVNLVTEPVLPPDGLARAAGDGLTGADLDTAAMAHLSISTPARHRAHTCDFHHWVTVANGTGLPDTADGYLRPPSGAGLGIEVDVAALGDPIVSVGG